MLTGVVLFDGPVVVVVVSGGDGPSTRVTGEDSEGAGHDIPQIGRLRPFFAGCAKRCSHSGPWRSLWCEGKPNLGVRELARLWL